MRYSLYIIDKITAQRETKISGIGMDLMLADYSLSITVISLVFFNFVLEAFTKIILFHLDFLMS